MERALLAEGFLKEKGFQLRIESTKSGCVVSVCWKGVPDHRCLVLKGPWTEGFCADSRDSKEFLITRPKRTRGLTTLSVVYVIIRIMCYL